MSQERPVLLNLAAYKYDEYQQFSAGSRFIECLTLWLNQFETVAERKLAYEFVKRNLVFCSSAEMRHLVEMAYPDHIRPILLDRAAGADCERFRPAAVAAGTAFKVRQRQCLFLGLSDGARIDTFRRANPDLNHEQIWQTYEISDQRVNKAAEEAGRAPTPDHRERTEGVRLQVPHARPARRLFGKRYELLRGSGVRTTGRQSDGSLRGPF